MIRHFLCFCFLTFGLGALSAQAATCSSRILARAVDELPGFLSDEDAFLFSVVRGNSKAEQVTIVLSSRVHILERRLAALNSINQSEPDVAVAAETLTQMGRRLERMRLVIQALRVVSGADEPQSPNASVILASILFSELVETDAPGMASLVAAVTRHRNWSYADLELHAKAYNQIVQQGAWIPHSVAAHLTVEAVRRHLPTGDVFALLGVVKTLPTGFPSRLSLFDRYARTEITNSQVALEIAKLLRSDRELSAKRVADLLFLYKELRQLFVVKDLTRIKAAIAFWRAGFGAHNRADLPAYIAHFALSDYKEWRTKVVIASLASTYYRNKPQEAVAFAELVLNQTNQKLALGLVPGLIKKNFQVGEWPGLQRTAGEFNLNTAKDGYQIATICWDLGVPQSERAGVARLFNALYLTSGSMKMAQGLTGAAWKAGLRAEQSEQVQAIANNLRKVRNFRWEQLILLTRAVVEVGQGKVFTRQMELAIEDTRVESMDLHAVLAIELFKNRVGAP